MSPPLPHRPGQRLLVALVLMSGVGVHSALAQNASPSGHPEQAFLADNAIAMTKMMNGMAIKPVGNIDKDFVAMMTPHHQGAIDMAIAYLRYGGNEQLRRIAQEIIVEQQQEIQAMQLALGQPLPPSAPVPTQPGAAAPLAAPNPDASHHGHANNRQETP